MKQRNSIGVFFLVLLGALIGFLPGTCLAQAGNAFPLLVAVKQGDVDVLKKLITNKDVLDTQDADGWTALMHATKAGHHQQVEMLLKAGASPNIGGRLGRTPLELATKVPAPITGRLIKAGANVNVRNAGGIPVIMTAAGEGREDVVKMLMGAGARLDYKDYQGNTIMDWARRGGNKQLISYLSPLFNKAVAETPEKSGEDFIEAVFADAVHPKWFKHSFLDLQEDLDDALKEGKKGLMVYFGLKRCSYCQAFMENTLSQPDIENRTRRLFNTVGMSIFSDIEMTDPTGKTYTIKDFVTVKKANYSPTMIFYGNNGQQLLKIVGYYPPKKFRHVLDYLEGDHYKTERLSTYINRQKAKTGLVKVAIQNDQLFPNKNYTLDRKNKPASRPLVVLFEQPGCKSCNRFHERVLSDKPIRRLLEQFDTLQLDATDTKTAIVTPEGSRIAPKTWYSRLGLNYSPAMVFYDEAGNEITRLDSETKRWRMEGTLQLILEKSYKKDTQVQRWRREKAVEFYQQAKAGQ